MAEDKERSHSSHKCCAAAQCINRSDNRKDPTFHAFPQDQDQRKIWMAKMKRGDQKFTSNISLFCCSAHFTAKDYRSSLTGKRRDLIKNAVPSIFPWTEDYDKGIRTERSERANVRDSKKLQLSVAPGVATDSVNTAEKEEAKPQEIEERDLVAEICELTQKVFLLKFGLERFSSNDDDICFYTGFSSYETLLTFWNFVKPSAESLLSWNQARSKVNGELEDTAFPYLQGQKKEKQRTREIEPIDQLWMFLSRMRLGLFERDLAHRFNVSVGTVSDIVITWANYLYLVLGSLPIWPSKDKIKQHLPESFKGRYESVRGILDCTELKCELPKDYQKHSEMYSDYKSHDTFKGLICISPSGWITFVSQLYPGRISDKEVVEKSNFCQLIEPGDQYLADKGFEIHDLIALRGGSLYIPPKRFSVFDQFTESQCFETMSIANVRIHVERAIKRIKAWNIFNQVLPLSSFGSINQIWTVCALLVNFQNPIISV